MALINCPECGKEVSDKAEKCPECGYPFDGIKELVDMSDNDYSEKDIEISNEEECKDEKIDLKLEDNAKEQNIPKESDEVINEEDGTNSEKKIIFNKKKLVILSIIAVICILGFIIYKTSDIGRYNSAQNAYKKKQYAEAMEKFKDLGTYKDSKKMYDKAKHMDAVSKDKTQPNFKNLPSKIEITVGEIFDGAKWCEENSISAVDDVTTNVKFSVDDSKIDAKTEGTYDFVLLAEDEAGNTKKEIVKIVVRKEYTQEEISNAVKSTYTDQIHGLQKIEYRKDSESVWVYLLSDGMAEAALGAKRNNVVKAHWDDMTKELDRISKEIYFHLCSEGYDDIDSVCLTLLNDLDSDNVLYASANGVSFFDVTEK